MPSTNKLSSRIRGNSLLGSRRSSRLGLRTYIAKFLYTFCGIASFGVVTMLAVAGAATTASATGNASNSNTVSANVSGVIAIRLLDSTATTEISELNFSLTPTSSGTSATQRAVVDVSTSNPTGYKLYMQSNYQIGGSGAYTTDLVHQDSDVSDVIPTVVPGSGGVSSDATLYWNYTNPMTSTDKVIPSHSGPADQLDQYFNTTNSRQTPVDINVSVDTTIVSGTYENELLFSAIANPSPVDYTISFNADGGSPTPSTIEETAESSVYSTTISSTAPSKTGYTFSHWNIEDTGYEVTCTNPSTSSSSTTTCNPGDTIRVYANGESTATASLTAIYTKNSYTVSITNSNTTSGAASLSIPYGESRTVTVTPNSGYYLSSVSCPSGYTCSGYGTGTSYTGQQTVTVQNNSTTSGGTLAFTGTLAAPTSCATATPVTPGQVAGTDNMYTSGGVQYIKLKTGASTSACYTKASRGTATWANASSLCPSGTGVPTRTEFNALISSNAYNTGSNLYTATGWNDNYWSSTSTSGSNAYLLYVGLSYSYVTPNRQAYSLNVVCIVR